PITVIYPDETENQPTDKDLHFIISPSNCILKPKFKTFFQKIQDFKVYPDDTWVVTFPKCGTTWTQEMVWLLVNNLDFEKATSTNLTARFP
ncbi:sulfotransferase domain-containing protein, partial [Klebsiella pneumoniae]|nr:sulfotransferase domain-containing protein [Klebsiella pneumoniae]